MKNDKNMYYLQDILVVPCIEFMMLFAVEIDESKIHI